MAKRDAERILADIASFRPEEGNWLPLEDLLAELWNVGVTKSALPVLFRVFERFPEDDGAGVLWSIIHGVEALDLDYENELRQSVGRQPSLMGETMMMRLEKANAR